MGPIDQKSHWGRPAIQTAFTIFVLAETWLVPIEGYFLDRIGLRVMVAIAGALVGLAWVINSRADSLILLYAGAAVGGLGAGIIYSAAIGNALTWFAAALFNVVAGLLTFLVPKPARIRMRDGQALPKTSELQRAAPSRFTSSTLSNRQM